MKLRFLPAGPELSISRLHITSSPSDDFSGIQVYLAGDNGPNREGLSSIRVDRGNTEGLFGWGGKQFRTLEIVEEEVPAQDVPSGETGPSDTLPPPSSSAPSQQPTTPESTTTNTSGGVVDAPAQPPAEVEEAP
jgi:hypothetical protein